ncbi:DUF4124 domain-containing protein [Xanthomonas oryzae]|uniref:DUF4124 domain-containing protein n=1 Tax=Xanthomonas oryzae pv. oryzae TaxID=64187 RepID=A0AAJ5SQ22_XANOO|nr:DUF4124 domain-containing protein [Xanthomonas oryzae]OLI94990.1 membrane protein [Xanthomonas oryzae pv. oryzae]QIE21053.1 DUF4124 domain-containing protein [Xanthomonas oryzae pv. oryzae]UXV80124.1 DUF4124 domain-containing protein [Xanthomonas oryzae pv. oryzae]UXW02744.1 DUF4124 domain-containing protein [Xanthomonas oryzae pv. oryzae]UXW15846.1 DUF4124 domain-containing protein [Xanthomonas oryzae pv. oryzae]
MQLSSGLCALLMLVSAAAGATDIYKWKDAKGVTHYTETPPPTGQRYEARQIDARSGAAAVAAAPTAAPESADCLTARRNLELLSGKGDVSMAAGADGKPGAVLDQETRATQRNLADAAVKAYCKPAATGGPATQ